MTSLLFSGWVSHGLTSSRTLRIHEAKARIDNRTSVGVLRNGIQPQGLAYL